MQVISYTQLAVSIVAVAELYPTACDPFRTLRRKIVIAIAATAIVGITFASCVAGGLAPA
jgi:hypothetical protein